MKHFNVYHSICSDCMVLKTNPTTYGAGPSDSYYPPGETVTVGKSEISLNLSDMVNSPSHYVQGDIECIDAIAEVVKHLDGMEAMCTGNAIKYLWRWKHKNGSEDLKKAVWYIQRMIDELDSE